MDAMKKARLMRVATEDTTIWLDYTLNTLMERGLELDEAMAAFRLGVEAVPEYYALMETQARADFFMD